MVDLNENEIARFYFEESDVETQQFFLGTARRTRNDNVIHFIHHIQHMKEMRMFLSSSA